jgi:hypothetical protein
MASKHTPHSGAHGPARIDITKKNKARRAKRRERIAAKRADKNKSLEGAKRFARDCKVSAQEPGAIINELGEQVGLVE